MNPHPAPGQRGLKRPGTQTPRTCGRTTRHPHPLPAPLPRAKTRSKLKEKDTINGSQRASVHRSLTPRGPRSPPRGCFCWDLRSRAGVRSLGSNLRLPTTPPRPTKMFSFGNISEPQAPKEGPRRRSAGGLREGKLDGKPGPPSSGPCGSPAVLESRVRAPAAGSLSGQRLGARLGAVPGSPAGPRGRRASHGGLPTRDEPPWAQSPLFCFPAGRDLGHHLDQRSSISRWGNRGLD